MPLTIVAPGVGGTGSSTFPFTGANAQIFNASGTFTIPTGVTAVKVTVCGGGGNGGAGFNDPCVGGWSGGGGGGAGVAIKWLTGLTPGNTITVTRGAAAGSSSISSGTQTITTVTGGGGGNGTAASSGFNGTLGSAGTATNGDINLASRNFVTASRLAGGGAGTFGGPEGSSNLSSVGFLGGCGGVSSATASVKNATGFGNGGGGGSSTTSGGSGSGGIIIFEW